MLLIFIVFKPLAVKNVYFYLEKVRLNIKFATKILNLRKSIFIIFVLCAQVVFAQNIDSLHNKYQVYRMRLLDEWLVTSADVEQMGVNIPAMDSRRSSSSGKRYWVSWSDGNANFNHWLGILSTEYRLLKNNGQDYSETLKMLVYAMLAIERLDLYSEYALRLQHGLIKEGEIGIKYPDDINGFLIRDDVSMGFWKQYHAKFGPSFGSVNARKDATGSYLSVFEKGVIPKEGMSQDNICYMMQGLALVKKLVDNEPIQGIKMNFINSYIPDYLSSKGIIRNNVVHFDVWVDDIVDRLIGQMYHDYPERRIGLKPKNKMKARPYETNFGAVQTSRWYITNPVTNDMVAEGNGEDMGVWINSYGIAEAASVLTGKNYHNDGSNYGLSKYVFMSVLFKDARILGLGGFALPYGLDDYMLRALATVGDINRGGEKSTALFYLLDDKREKWTYEHNPLILYLLFPEKYSKIYHSGVELYDSDRIWYSELLMLAPKDGPSTDTTRADWSKYWSSTSRLNWPSNITGRRQLENPYEYCGMDYMFLYNLYRLVFASEGYELNNNKQKKEVVFPKPEMTEPDYQYYYNPPQVKQ